MLKFEAVLPKKLTAEVITVEVFSATIKDKSKTKQVLDVLKTKYPLESLNHLKRIRSYSQDKKRLHVIIAPVKEIDLLTLENSDDLKELVGDFRVTEVPSQEPLTKKQFSKASTYWPTKFHENKEISKLTKDELFTKSQNILHSNYMNKLKHCNNHATIVVNPETNKQLAFAYDCTNLGDPLLHSIIVAIDMVAYSQGGGALECLKYKKHDDGYYIVDTAETNGDIVEQEERDVMEGYLCTGYDVYTTMEPCVMCSMALLHSRVGRVFYGSTNKHFGGLGAKYQIHCEEGLNHHFDVFRVV